MNESCSRSLAFKYWGSTVVVLLYYCYHLYSIYETGHKTISHTKMDYLNLEKKLKN